MLIQECDLTIAIDLFYLAELRPCDLSYHWGLLVVCYDNYVFRYSYLLTSHSMTYGTQEFNATFTILDLNILDELKIRTGNPVENNFGERHVVCTSSTREMQQDETEFLNILGWSGF